MIDINIIQKYEKITMYNITHIYKIFIESLQKKTQEKLKYNVNRKVHGSNLTTEVL